tara:strand:- start:2365 stop:2592 length:228 start_codon:yes stop_codon:yes gene_type:complete
MDKPEPVRRVIPPTTKITTTLRQTQRNQVICEREEPLSGTRAVSADEADMGVVTVDFTGNGLSLNHNPFSPSLKP